ncbi:uncharacterized protein MELLADRAFT_111018 [Melampsora larici-populina 98AG31]|uniref:Uncharacterized protein n=1 Tax=Melampsora larici-populina (strain 98AG31 / pathotype 3-4-7) TaxID=747676 RepID=F4S1S3_MELLP|nr:uncharacterized protein MELLADRAFT_111018 [Melampsora larici-populina 98AG31]EGG01455.1 hypothetical protein MELLADRAFT_111018 [Melampsora larici-populina 98AG31]
MSSTSGPSLSLEPILDDISQLDTNPKLVEQLSSTIGIQPIQTRDSQSLEAKPTLPKTPDQAVDRALEMIGLEKNLKTRSEELEERDVGGRLETSGKVVDKLLHILEHASIPS